MNFQLEYLISTKMMFLGHLRLAKDELISTKNWAKQMSLRILLTVNRLVILNLYLMINIIQVLIFIGSGLKTPQKSYLDKSILTQSETCLICLGITQKMKLILLWSQKLKLTIAFQYLNLLWRVLESFHAWSDMTCG